MDLKGALLRNRVLTEYLKELELLTGRHVTPAELLTVESTLAVRESLSASMAESQVVAEMDFRSMQEVRFGRFVDRLTDANPSPVQIWTPRTAACGLLVIPNLRHVNFRFDFLSIPEGILSFVTCDLSDRLVIDFSYADDGTQVLKIETAGDNWSRVYFD